MDLRQLRPALVLAGWTFLVWTTRIGNIWTDDSLTTAGQVWRTALALVFTAFAAVVVAAWVRERRSGTVWPWLPTWIRAFAVVTVGVWAVRAVQIGAADHDTAFKVVHTVLAIVSTVLALWAHRDASRQNPAGSSANGPHSSRESPSSR